jgi:hypothetical protein
MFIHCTVHNSSSVEMVKKIWNIYTVEYYSAIKEYFICNKMERTGEHYAK